MDTPMSERCRNVRSCIYRVSILNMLLQYACEIRPVCQSSDFCASSWQRQVLSAYRRLGSSAQPRAVELITSVSHVFQRFYAVIFVTFLLLYGRCCTSVVWRRDGAVWGVCWQVFSSLNLTAYDLSVDMLDVHAVSITWYQHVLSIVSLQSPARAPRLCARESIELTIMYTVSQKKFPPFNCL